MNLLSAVILVSIVLNLILSITLYTMSKHRKDWRDRALHSEDDYRKLQDAIAAYRERNTSSDKISSDRDMSNEDLPNDIRPFDPRSSSENSDSGSNEERSHFPVV